MGKKVVVKLHSLIKKHNISMRELGRLADIRPAALNALANQKRRRVELLHIEKIAKALNISDMNEILLLKDIDEDENEHDESPL
ncbi:helix-turn-helix transcriptional regulator [Bacillus sp. B15-48]|uniref:helix-turn-helix domain-containing protein n=1 Tax=Bacillus sp. B15-48 TaxID=1548601 RepID=UPI00193FBA36|nr:helix-turn-helix transcriptional regulator [Bacillus sp. B15-48]MBM4765105.1 helix-turn-helix domain-containing protein [Bacillus sp. B15-48]